MKSLPEIFITSLVPSGALLGVLFAYYRRKQPTSIRGAMLWLGLTFAAGGATFYYLIKYVAAPVLFCGPCIFAFVYPPAVFYWMRFLAVVEPGLRAFAKILGVPFFLLLGSLWSCLVFLISLHVIRNVERLFK